LLQPCGIAPTIALPTTLQVDCFIPPTQREFNQCCWLVVFWGGNIATEAMAMWQGKGCQYCWMCDATTTEAPPSTVQVDCFFLHQTQELTLQDDFFVWCSIKGNAAALQCCQCPLDMWHQNAATKETIELSCIKWFYYNVHYIWVMGTKELMGAWF